MRHLIPAFVIGAGLAFGASAADKVKIGFMSTLSGPAAAIGGDVRDAFQLLIKLNGGKLGGLPAEVIVVDDQLNADVGKQGVERLLKRERVDLMTGMVFSAVLLPVIPAILEAQTFYISPNTGPKDYAGEKCNPYFFAAAWQNEDVANAMGRFVTERGIKNVTLVAPNYPGGRETLDGFKRTFKGKYEEIYTKLNQLDYGAELAQIRASKPEAMFVFLPGGMGINFVKQYVASGLSKDVQLFVPGFNADEDTLKALGDSMLGVFNTSQWAHDLDNPANKKFVEAFRKEYNRLPTMYASQGW